MEGQLTNGNDLDIQESNLAISKMSSGESEHKESSGRPWWQRYESVPGQVDNKCTGDSCGEEQKRHDG